MGATAGSLASLVMQGKPSSSSSGLAEQDCI
jgi:hypothetical protein